MSLRRTELTTWWQKPNKQNGFLPHICKPHPPHSSSYYHPSTSPLKWILSQNCRHTSWAQISLFSSVERRQEKPSQGLERPNKNRNPPKKPWYDYKTDSLSGSDLVMQTSRASFSVTATDNSAIVWISRQLDTHSKNVSLLCSPCTKGCLSPFLLGKHRP